MKHKIIKAETNDEEKENIPPLIQTYEHESIFEKDYEENHDFGDEDEHIKDLMKERGF
jgi:hypothetical protein